MVVGGDVGRETPLMEPLDLAFNGLRGLAIILYPINLLNIIL